MHRSLDQDPKGPAGLENPQGPCQTGLYIPCKRSRRHQRSMRRPPVVSIPCPPKHSGFNQLRCICLKWQPIVNTLVAHGTYLHIQDKQVLPAVCYHTCSWGTASCTLLRMQCRYCQLYIITHQSADGILLQRMDKKYLSLCL